MAAWEAQAVHQLALAAAAFAAPHTTPQEDVELLLGAAAGGGGGASLLQTLRFSPAPGALQQVVASVQALTAARRQWRVQRTATLGGISVERAGRGVVLGAELAQLLRVELPARDVHVAARQPGRLADLPTCLRDIVRLPERRAAEADETLRTFCCAIAKVGGRGLGRRRWTIWASVVLWCSQCSRAHLPCLPRPQAAARHRRSCGAATPMRAWSTRRRRGRRR